MNTYEKQKSKLPSVATIVSTIIPGWGWEWILSNSTKDRGFNNTLPAKDTFYIQRHKQIESKRMGNCLP